MTTNLSATPDFKLINIPTDKIQVLTLLGANSERYPNIIAPTFIEPVFKQKTYLPLRGRLLKYSINRSYRLKNELGKEDWSIPPLCFSNDGVNPAPELEESYSEKCREVNEKGKLVLCQFAQKTKKNPSDKKATIQAECREMIYFLMYLNTGEFYWICFKGGARIFQAVKFITCLNSAKIRKKVSQFHDYIIEINLIKQPYKRGDGEIVYPVIPTFKILNYDIDEGYNPDDSITQLVELWTKTMPQTLSHYVTTNSYNVEETEKTEQIYRN